MACSCTQISNPSDNCTVCNNTCDNCSCEQYLTPPVVECPDPVKCDQVYPTDCVVYNGESIQCSIDAYQLYPNVNHHIVLSTATEQQRTVNAMLNNINMQLCYIFSKDYIANMLTIINNDPDLKLLFCQIVNSCDCTCSLTCPTITNITYVPDTLVDKMEVTFDLPTGGTAPYNYKVAVYSKLPNGQYTYISGQVSTTVNVVGSSGVSLVNLGTSGTSGSDYVVSVFVEDSVLCNVGYFNNSSTPFNYTDVQNNCGVGFYQGVAAPLNCCLECNSGQTFTLNTINNRLVHTFDVPTLGVNCHPITSYTVHWYKYNGSGLYNYMDSEVHIPPYSSTVVTELIGSVPTDTILVIILTETAATNCFTGVEPRVGGYFTQAELALLDSSQCFSLIFEPTITPL